jgi:hypothetical protein
VLGEEVAYLDLVDPEADTRTVWSLINDLTAAERQITLINTRAVLFTWEGVAAKTTEFYERILKLLPRVQGINPGTGMPVYGGQKQNGNLAQEYQRLEKWANELSQRLVTIEKKPLYRLLSRFRLL